MWERYCSHIQATSNSDKPCNLTKAAWLITRRFEVKASYLNEWYIGFVLFFCLLPFSRATPTACGGSQARGSIGAAATGLCQSHSNLGSEPHLWPTPQLTAMPDP